MRTPIYLASIDSLHPQSVNESYMHAHHHSLRKLTYRGFSDRGTQTILPAVSSPSFVYTPQQLQFINNV